jgi:uncharacterized membrane protein
MPISFLSASYLLDITYGVATHESTSKFIASIYNVTPYLGDIARFSHYFNILGLLIAVPAILTGGQQLMIMIKNQDLASKFEKSQNKAVTAQKMHPKMKLGFAHAALNDLTIAGSAYMWWVRRSTPGHVPDESSLFISVGLLLALSVAGYLGAAMVYDHGVGVVNKAKKAKGQ